MRSCLGLAYAQPIAAVMFTAHGRKKNAIVPAYICDLSQVSYRTPWYTATQIMVKCSNVIGYHSGWRL